MKRNVLHILVTLCVIISLQSCYTGTQGVWVNGDINSDIKKQITALNQKLFKAIMARDTNGVKALLSTKLLQKAGKKLDTLIYTSAQNFQAKDYEVLDEYYTKHHVKGPPDTLLSNKGNISDYMVSYKAMNAEMYTSLLVTKELPVNGLMLIGEYSINNKTAPDYYKMSKEEYNKGNLVDATDLIIIASQLANPAGDFFKYTHEDTMRIFSATILNEANNRFSFPVVIVKITTKPQIFSVEPQFIGEAGHEGIFPLIKYKSAIKLTDSVALKAENNAIQQVIGSMFKGIDQNKKYILYQAFDQIPNGKPGVKHYGFIQNIKQN
jgi:hypothetical protein